MFTCSKRSIYSFGLFFLMVAYMTTTSCVSSRNILYFRDVPDTMSAPVTVANITPYTDPKIESNDILAVTVQTLVQNPGNSPITSTSQGTFNLINGLLVDKNGYIELSLLGFVKVAGLTTTEARELIKQKAKEFYKDPVVNVRIANFDIEVFGDVAKPGVVNIPNEKASILDVIALSGDVNITAKKGNVMLARTEGDEKKFYRFDLTSSKVYQHPAFWLRQHDQVFVEPNKYKVQSSDQTFLRNLGILSTVISIASLVLIFRTVK